MVTKIDIEVPRTVRAPALARRALRGLELDPGTAQDLRLLVSELVTNSVKYGGEGPVRLAVLATPRSVRVEVTDMAPAGPGRRPALRAVDREHPGGWGLRLVEQLAEDWGVDADGGRPTRVWFELPLAEARATPRRAARG